MGPGKILAVKLNCSDFGNNGVDEAACLGTVLALDGLVDLIEVSGGTRPPGWTCLRRVSRGSDSEQSGKRFDNDSSTRVEGQPVPFQL